MALLRDLRYALRQMINHRIFAATVILTLALSIGAATAVFGLFDAVLLRPFPYRDSQNLVRLFTYEPGVKGTTRGGPQFTISKTTRPRTRAFFPSRSMSPTQTT
jgi:hypothetical protein